MNVEAELDLIWGAGAIGKAIGRTTRQTFHMLESGELPAMKVGNRWVIERGNLRAFFVGAAAHSQIPNLPKAS